MEYHDRDIELEDLLSDLKSKFRKKGDKIKARLRDKSYSIDFFSYEYGNAIEDDDDLITEIESVFPEEPDIEPDEDTIIELRIIFTKPSIIYISMIFVYELLSSS